MLVYNTQCIGKRMIQTNPSKFEERERETETETDRQTDRQNSNSKTLILKDSSVRSIWTYLTASPCYTTNTNKQRQYHKQIL